MYYCMYNPGLQVLYDGSLPVGIHQGVPQPIKNIKVREQDPRAPKATILAKASAGILRVDPPLHPRGLPVTQIMAMAKVLKDIEKNKFYWVDYTHGGVQKSISLRSVASYRRGPNQSVRFTSVS